VIVAVILAQFDAYPVAPESAGCGGCGSAAEERIEDGAGNGSKWDRFKIS
jgi:hypothetical protein